MDNKINLIFLVCVLFTISIASADLIDYYKQGETVNVILPCSLNSSPCPSTVLCNISMSYPNGSLQVYDQPMQNNIGFYNYTLPDSGVMGEYTGNAYCTNGQNNDVYSFSIFINNSGETENDYLYVGFFITLIGVVFAYLYAGFNVDDNKFGVKILLFFTAFFNIIGALLSSILIQTSWLTLYQISEALLWLNGLMILIMASYYIFYFLTKKMDDIENA